MTSRTYVVYGKAVGCNPCNMAKQLLEKHDMPFEFRNIDTDPIAKKYILDLGLREVPQVFAPDGQRIGNYNDLVAFIGL